MKKVGDIFQKILLSISFSGKEKSSHKARGKLIFGLRSVFYSSDYLKAMYDFNSIVIIP